MCPVYHIWKLYFLFGHLLHKMEFRQELILGSTVTLFNERHIQPSCLYRLHRKKGTWTTEGSFYSSSHILVVNASCPLEMLKSYHKQFSAMVPAFVAWDPKAPSLTTFYSVPAHCLIFLSYHSPHFPSIYYILTSLLECFGLELSASPIMLELFFLYTTSDIRQVFLPLIPTNFNTSGCPIMTLSSQG